MLLAAAAPNRKGVSPDVSGAGGGRAFVLLVIIVAVAANLLAVLPVHALTLTVKPARAQGPGAVAGAPAEIRATGPFLSGDSDQLAAALQSLEQQGGLAATGPRAVVDFDSTGGSLDEGMRMGRVLRRFGVGTLIRAGDRCLSACALAFLGGATPGPEGAVANRSLEIGGQLGFHAFYATRDPGARDAATSRARGVTEGRAMSAVIIAYVIDMGVDPEHVLRALIRPPDDMTYIEAAGEFASLGVCPVGLPASSATLADRATNICANVTRGTMPVWADLIVEYTPVEARRLLLGEVARDAAQANVTAGLATRLQQVLRGGRGIEALYDELAAAGMPLPTMRARGFHLEMPGLRTSCFVTLSPTGMADYGVVLLTPSGIAAPRIAAPSACSELLGFHHDEIINPRRGSAVGRP